MTDYLNATAIYDECGKFTQSRTTIIDITERKKAEKQLRASEERLNFMLSKSPAGIFTAAMTAGTPITFISDSVHDILGYEPRQYLEDPGFWLSRVHPDELGQSLEEAGRTLLLQGHVVWESRVRRADGEYHWMSTGASLVRDQNGKPVEMIGYLVDIHEARQAQEALQNSEAQLRRSRDELAVVNAALEKAARAKDEFLASMSHELRTPLTGILGLSEALQYKTYGDLTLKQENALKNIESSGRHLLELINDILDLSKIEAGQLSLETEVSSLADICQASLQLTKGLAHQKRQHVSFSITPADLWVSADPRRLKQMLVNLLSNAIKFTANEGSLGLLVDGSAAEQVIRLTVWDTGIGIRSEDLPRLFQPFTQLDSSLARQNTGTGLGLSLVLRMAELHGGSVQVKSVPGEGSRFTIVLPWPAPNFQTLPPVPPDTDRLGRALTAEVQVSLAAGPLILIIDDNEMIAQTTADLLTASGFQVTISPGGLEALELVAQIYPDLILMDIQMPGLDGHAVTRQLRAHPDPRVARLPIIAVTALAMTGDRERCLAAGVDEYLSKPFALNRLKSLINQLLKDKK
jgi:PAS domain S-box-containing protein